MARTRSPGYPASPLREAIEMVRRIHEADYTHSIDRESAVKHMGFTGKSGSSDRMLAVLMHYGLIERVGKGEVKVSQRAVDIIHPESDADRKRALVDAAFAPDLFQDIRGRFPDRPPSEETLRSHLMRKGFTGIAVTPAIRAYLGTIEYLQQVGAYESHGLPTGTRGESSPEQGVLEKPPMQHTVIAAPPPTQKPAAPLGRNDIRLELHGTSGSVHATFDKKGLAKLIAKLQAVEAILDDDAQDMPDAEASEEGDTAKAAWMTAP